MVSKVETKETKKRKGGRPKGTPKTGGRTKGIRNRNSMKFLDNLDGIGINLIEEFLSAIRKLTPHEQVHEFRFLIAHAYPRLKDVEPNINQEEETVLSSVSTEDLMRALE